MHNRTTINCHFENIEHEIKKELKAAKERIWICVAWINIPAYQTLLAEKVHSGVDVKILCNSDNKNRLHLPHVLYQLKDKIIFIKNPIPATLMHHKFCIIDDCTLINGSFNWSKSAYYHYENIVVIKNDYRLINKFKHQFSDLIYMASLSRHEFSHIMIRKNTCQFTLGMISSSHGKYDTSTLQKWHVDLESCECHKLEEVDIPHFLTSIDNSYIIDDLGEDKESYQELFDEERKYMDKVQSYFDSSRNRVHAIGSAIKVQHHKYDEEEPEINLFWIDTRFRKIIPTSISVNGDFEMVFNEAYYAGS